jgi:hypothetical protein
MRTLSLLDRSRASREAIAMTKRSLDEGQMSMRQERLLGVTLLVAGLAIAGAAVSRMGSDGAVAQATPPAVKDDKPAESMPGGTRPTTPAPEPARPQSQDPDGSTTGSSPISPRTGDRTPLPPAPAEKTAPPIEKKN